MRVNWHMRTTTFWMCSGAGMRPSMGSWWLRPQWAWSTGSWHTPGPGTGARGRWTGSWILLMMSWRLRPGLAMPAWRAWCMAGAQTLGQTITGTKLACLSTNKRQLCHRKASCWFSCLGHLGCITKVVDNLFRQHIQCILITLQWWHVCEIHNVHP